MGAPENQQPASRAADATCGECGHTDNTVRDLGLKQPIALCDPCFNDLTATRTLAGPLPLSRVLGDVLTGADPLDAGRRSDTWRRNAPEPEPADVPREDQSA